MKSHLVSLNCVHSLLIIVLIWLRGWQWWWWEIVAMRCWLDLGQCCDDTDSDNPADNAWEHRNILLCVHHSINHRLGCWVLWEHFYKMMIAVVWDQFKENDNLELIIKPIPPVTKTMDNISTPPHHHCPCLILVNVIKRTRCCDH